MLTASGKRYLAVVVALQTGGFVVVHLMIGTNSRITSPPASGSSWWRNSVSGDQFLVTESDNAQGASGLHALTSDIEYARENEEFFNLCWGNGIIKKF